MDDLRIQRPARMDSPTRLWPLAILLVVTILALGTVWWLKRPKTIEVRTVTAREVAGKDAEHTVLNASGYVTARREATVSSKVMGKVTELLIE